MRIAMVNIQNAARLFLLSGILVGAAVISGCASTTGDLAELPTASGEAQHSTRYRIAPGDSVQVFVWRNPELSTTVRIRPDGILSAPLLEEVPAAGKTPAELAQDIETELSKVLRDPLVTIIVDDFAGTFRDQIRIVGAAAEPKAILYTDSMTLLDVLIQTGGVTDFADGNNSRLVRVVDGKQQSFRLRIDDLIRNGDISANVDVQPGDVVIVPEAWF
jgi:polysaccharide export outer membrane protein